MSMSMATLHNSPATPLSNQLANPMANRPKRLTSIDALRGAAALTVLFYHAVGLHAFTLKDINIFAFIATYPLQCGYVGVHLFLVLSGFCIHMRLASRQENGPDPMTLPFRDFWRRRFHRLYPPYLATLIFSFIMYVVYAMWKANNFSLDHAGEILTVLRWDFLTHLLMIHLFFPAFSGGMGNGALWSLALEEHLYILYSPVLWIRNRIGMGGMLLVAAGVTLAWRGVFVFGYGVRPGLPAGMEQGWKLLLLQAPSRWFEWCLGAYAVEAYFGLVKLPAWMRRWTTFFAVAGLAMLSAYHVAGWWIHDTLWGCAFFCLVNAMTHREADAVSQGRTQAPWIVGKLAFFGMFSYSIYLIHKPILIGAKLFSYNFGLSWWAYGAVAFATAVGCIPLAYVFFHLFEKPFITTNAKKAMQADKTNNAETPADAAIKPQPQSAVSAAA